MSNEDLSYSGPDREYTPQPGSNKSQPQVPNLGETLDPSSLEDLKNDIIHIINRSNIIISKCDNELSIFSLDVGKNQKTLEAANDVWSNFPNFPTNLVTYKQVDLLDKNNRSSKILFDNFKKELRKPNGSSALEIKELTQIILREAQEINKIINLNFFGSNTSAERRLIELLVGFSSLIKSHLNKIDSFFTLPKNERNRALPKNELDGVSKEDAIKYQSIFSLSVNGLNDEIDKDIDYLRRFFTNSSEYFYTKIIAPLVNLKAKTPNSYSQNENFTNLQLWSKDVDDALNRNVVTGLYDVSDRSYKMDEAISTLEEKISLRENYLGYIRQMQGIGISVNTALTLNSDSVNLVEKEKSNTIINDHNSLSGRTDKKSHEQYLLKSNDYLRGDLIVNDGVKIDGIDVSLHEHSGSDGSSLIDGKYIENNSLKTSLIKTEYEDKPINLKIIEFDSDQRSVGAKLFWLSKNQNVLNEIQVSKIKDTVFIDPGQEEPEQPEVPINTQYVPPFESYGPLYIEWITEIDYELFFN